MSVYIPTVSFIACIQPQFNIYSSVTITSFEPASTSRLSHGLQGQKTQDMQREKRDAFHSPQLEVWHKAQHCCGVALTHEHLCHAACRGTADCALITKPASLRRRTRREPHVTASTPRLAPSWAKGFLQLLQTLILLRLMQQPQWLHRPAVLNMYTINHKYKDLCRGHLLPILCFQILVMTLQKLLTWYIV